MRGHEPAARRAGPGRVETLERPAGDGERREIGGRPRPLARDGDGGDEEARDEKGREDTHQTHGQDGARAPLPPSTTSPWAGPAAAR